LCNTPAAAVSTRHTAVSPAAAVLPATVCNTLLPHLQLYVTHCCLTCNCCFNTPHCCCSSAIASSLRRCMLSSSHVNAVAACSCFREADRAAYDAAQTFNCCTSLRGRQGSLRCSVFLNRIFACAVCLCFSEQRGHLVMQLRLEPSHNALTTQNICMRSLLMFLRGRQGSL
jgi:hypothetical protein